jgi:hypothetical protein
VPWLLPLVNDVFNGNFYFVSIFIKKRALENVSLFLRAQHCHFCEMKNIGKKTTALLSTILYESGSHNLQGAW